MSSNLTSSVRPGRSRLRSRLGLRIKGLGLTGGFLFVTGGCASALSNQTAIETTPEISYEVVGSHPHDPTAFTQGFFYEDGFLFEGTGRRGMSVLRKTDLESGSILKEVSIDASLFGEGIASHRGRVFQLTWQSGQGFVYDRETLTLNGRFRFQGEGWGLTGDGRRLIMSDGTSTIRYLDPETLEETDRIEVRDLSGPVDQLNELEFIGGEIFANVWHEERIIRILPETGSVSGEIDLSDLVASVPTTDAEAVLNGIAWNPETGHLYVTGKLWPVIFELRLLEQEAD